MLKDMTTGKTNHDAMGCTIIECLCKVCGATWWVAEGTKQVCASCGYYLGAHKVEVPEHVLVDAMRILFVTQSDEALTCRAEIGNAMRVAYSKR